MWACAAGAFCAAAPYQSFAIFLRPVAESLGWSREAAAASFGTMALLAAAAAAPVGRLLDRYGARRMVLPSLTLLGVAVASLSLLTPSLIHLYAASAVIGLATVGASPVAYSRAIFSWFDRQRGRALGLMLAGPAIAAIVMPPIVASLIQHFGWRAAWFAVGLLILGFGVPVVSIWLHDRTAATSRRDATGDGSTVRDALRSRRFWTLIAVIFGSALMISGFIVHGAALLTDRAFTATQAATVISIYGAANLGGRLLTGWLLDRYPAPRVAAIMLTLAAGGALLLARADGLATAAVAAVLVGVGAGGEIDINPYLLSRYFGMRSLSTLYGFNWMALGISSAIGPVLMGRAFDATGSYATVLSQLAAVTLATAGLMLTLPPPQRLDLTSSNRRASS